MQRRTAKNKALNCKIQTIIQTIKNGITRQSEKKTCKRVKLHGRQYAATTAHEIIAGSCASNEFVYAKWF